MTSGGDTAARRGPYFFGIQDFLILAHLKQKFHRILKEFIEKY